MSRRVLLNGVPTDLAFGQSATIGEVLQALEGAVAASGHVVTAIRLDGVDEPAFGSPALRDRRLPPSTVVEVDTDTAAALIGRCVDEALMAMPNVRAGIVDVSAAFRLSNVSDANRLLAEVAESLGSLVGLAAAISSATGVALDKVATDGHSGAQLVAALHTHAGELTTAQSLGDWAQVADTLQFKVAPLVDAFAHLLEDLADRARMDRPVPEVPRTA